MGPSSGSGGPRGSVTSADWWRAAVRRTKTTPNLLPGVGRGGPELALSLVHPPVDPSLEAHMPEPQILRAHIDDELPAYEMTAEDVLAGEPQVRSKVLPHVGTEY